MKNNTQTLQEYKQKLIESRILSKDQEIKLWVPIKIPAAVNHIPEELLLKINSDVKISKELIIYFLSFLCKTQFFPEEQSVHLNSKILNNIFRPLGCNRDSVHYKIYKSIIQAVKIGTPEKGPIVFENEKYAVGLYSKSYSYSFCYNLKGTTKYTVKNKIVKQMIHRNYYEMILEQKDNSIIKNLLELYKILELPSKEHLINVGKKLTSENYHTKGGKRLIFRNKNANSHFKNLENLSFVEDNIKKFEYLTQPGFLLPMDSGINAGGRVVDSLVLMPGWIRNEITIDGEKLSECDYKCLHPNIAISLYSGNSKYLTHQFIAYKTNQDLKIIKTEHLSFFNRRPQDMQSKDFLFSFYNEIEPEMMQKIIKDKNEFGHKHTSKIMFKKEVDLMKINIQKLNQKGIYVAYVYDALLCKPKDKMIVEQIMNETALEMDINTTTGTIISEQQTEQQEMPVQQPSKEQESKDLDSDSKAVYSHLKQLETFSNYIGNVHVKTVSDSIKTVLNECEIESLHYKEFLKLIQKAQNKNKIIKDLKISDFLEVQIYQFLTPKKVKWNYDTMSVMNEEKEIYNL